MWPAIKQLIVFDLPLKPWWLTRPVHVWVRAAGLHERALKSAVVGSNAFLPTLSADKLWWDWEQTWQLLSRARPTFALCVSQPLWIKPTWSQLKHTHTHKQIPLFQTRKLTGLKFRAASVEGLQTGQDDARLHKSAKHEHQRLMGITENKHSVIIHSASRRSKPCDSVFLQEHKRRTTCMFIGWTIPKKSILRQDMHWSVMRFRALHNVFFQTSGGKIHY